MMADLIDRQTIIETIHSAIYPYFCGAEDGDALSKDEKLVLSVNKAVCTAIKALPSADVQPVRHGRWIKHDVVKMLYDGRTLDGFVTCNKCQSVYALEAMEWAYCPICGSHNWEGQYD